MQAKDRQLSFTIPDEIYEKYNNYILKRYGVKPNGNKSNAREIRNHLLVEVMKATVENYMIDCRDIIDEYMDGVL